MSRQVSVSTSRRSSHARRGCRLKLRWLLGSSGQLVLGLTGSAHAPGRSAG